MGPFAPFLATIQALSSTRIFVLLGENERKLLCMGRTSTANKPLPLYLGPEQLSFSWESNPRGANNNGNLIQWTSGYTRLVQWNSRGFDTDKCL
jgi:hypothetical protein